MFFSVLMSEGNLFSNFAVFFLLLFIIFTRYDFDCKALLICPDSLEFLVLYSSIILSTFLAIELLRFISFLISLIWSEIISKVNCNWSLVSSVAEEISCSICFFRSFSCFRRCSASIFNLWILFFCAKLCSNVLEISSNSERIFNIFRCIELTADIDFLRNNLAVLKARKVLLRIFDDLIFFCFNCKTLLVIEFISKSRFD